MKETAEQLRLIAANEDRVDWKKWGPYLSERAWVTVREDCSAYGTARDYFTHDQARSRTYRWHLRPQPISVLRPGVVERP